jgi:hypothetical protein
MKVLQKVILGLGLVVGSVYAQDVSNTIHSPGYIKVHISEYSDRNAGVQPDTFAMRFSRL